MKPAKTSSSATSKALAREVRGFCERNHLTPRESEILSLLVEGVVRIKEVAVKLKLSPNTVNNHVNSIFMKTRTRSKSEVLAELLGSVAEELQTARAWRKSPRVLIYEQDPSAGTALAKELQPRGFRCRAIPELDRLESAIAEFGPDFVLVDSTSLRASPREIVDRVAAMTPAAVVFSGSGTTCREAMDAGAIDCLARPLDVVKLANFLAVASIEDDAERSRWHEREAVEFKTLAQPLSCTPENVGRGGILISAKDVAAALGTAPTTGDWLEFKMTLDKSAEPFSARGQVVWTQAPGDRAGIRFTYLPSSAREKIASFVRQHSLRSYIPCG